MKFTLPNLGTVKIWFRHYPASGTTAIAAPTSGGAPVAQGDALLSRHDHFCRAKGRRVALRKLLDSLSLTRDQRRDVWVEYFTQHRDLRG